MTRNVLQKYLGWAIRYFYAIEDGVLPPTRLGLSIDHDWPLQSEIKRIQGTYNTAVGTVTTAAYTVPDEKHALVYLFDIFRSTAGIFDPSDIIQVNITHLGLAVPLFQINGSAAVFSVDLDLIPVIGGLVIPSPAAAIGSGFTFPIHGVAPVILGPGDSIQIVHTSAAAAVAAGFIGMVLERLKSYPLRLP